MDSWVQRFLLAITMDRAFDMYKNVLGTSKKFGNPIVMNTLLGRRLGSSFLLWRFKKVFLTNSLAHYRTFKDWFISQVHTLHVSTWRWQILSQCGLWKHGIWMNFNKGRLNSVPNSTWVTFLDSKLGCNTLWGASEFLCILQHQWLFKVRVDTLDTLTRGIAKT